LAAENCLTGLPVSKKLAMLEGGEGPFVAVDCWEYIELLQFSLFLSDLTQSLIVIADFSV